MTLYGQSLGNICSWQSTKRLRDLAFQSTVGGIDDEKTLLVRHEADKVTTNGDSVDRQ